MVLIRELTVFPSRESAWSVFREPSIWISVVRNTRLVLIRRSILQWKPLTVSQIPQKHIPRFSVVEVMGRRAGFIALWSGIAGSARAIFADSNTTAEQIVDHLRKYHFTSGTIVLAEGAGKAEPMAEILRAGITCTYPCKCTCFYPARRQSDSKRPCLWKL